MASSSSSVWTEKQNKLFENAIATGMYERDTPDRFQRLAKAVGGGKTVEEVKRHYECLVLDVRRIESGKVPLPNYGGTTNQFNDCEQRMKYMKLQ